MEHECTCCGAPCDCGEDLDDFDCTLCSFCSDDECRDVPNLLAHAERLGTDGPAFVFGPSDDDGSLEE